LEVFSEQLRSHFLLHNKWNSVVSSEWGVQRDIFNDGILPRAERRQNRAVEQNTREMDVEHGLQETWTPSGTLLSCRILHLLGSTFRWKAERGDVQARRRSSEARDASQRPTTAQPGLRALVRFRSVLESLVLRSAVTPLWLEAGVATQEILTSSFHLHDC